MSRKSSVFTSSHLARTNCSVDMDQSEKQSQIVLEPNRGKKRIGRYSFYLKNVIGSGYSGKVYKGIKDNIKNIWYAIKVIKLKQISIANQLLLKNQIEIIQQLNHPNILQFLDVQYTLNNCYLITQYCEGGNLQKYIKHNDYIQWGTIIYQIAQGCQYLASKNIVHRDLKPANIFLKNGVWKIGDFGFSKKINTYTTILMQDFKVGSPLFMPLQTLEHNMYSMKSDSYSLGVMIYYLIFRKYPFKGQSNSQLIHKIKQNEIQFKNAEFLKQQIINLIKGLCARQPKTRLFIQKCNFEIFLNFKSIGQIQNNLIKLNKISEQVTLCQFINYLMKNSLIFLEDNDILYSLLSDCLYHLTTIFNWQNNKSLRQMRQSYIITQSNIKITEELYRKILKSIIISVNTLKIKVQQSKIYTIAIQKFLQFYIIIECILHADIQKLSQILKNTSLHQNYMQLIPNNQKVKQMLSLIII